MAGANPLPILTMADLCSPCETIGVFGDYQTLPFITIRQIWLGPYRAEALPGSTSAVIDPYYVLAMTGTCVT